MCERGYIDNNFFDSIDYPKFSRNIPKVLTEKQILSLIEISYKDESFKGRRFSVMLEILYATGIRISELVSLKVGDLSDDLSYMVILNKGERQRLIPLISKIKKPT